MQDTAIVIRGGGSTDISSEHKFEQIMELYGSIMHRVAFKILKNDVDAEEAVQETLLKLFRNKTVPDLDNEAIAAKLSVAVKNMALDFYAKLVKHQTIHYEDSINSENPGMCEPSVEAAVNDRVDLQRCIERLPRLQKEYIQLRYHQDLNIKEIPLLICVACRNGGPDA